MANIKSQIKRNRQTVKRNLANRKVRSEIHTRTKNADAAIAAGADDGSIRLVYVDAPAVGGHADYCNALCWTDASTLVSGGRDGAVRSWRV